MLSKLISCRAWRDNTCKERKMLIVILNCKNFTQYNFYLHKRSVSSSRLFSSELVMSQENIIA